MECVSGRRKPEAISGGAGRCEWAGTDRVSGRSPVGEARWQAARCLLVPSPQLLGLTSLIPPLRRPPPFSPDVSFPGLAARCPPCPPGWELHRSVLI